MRYFQEVQISPICAPFEAAEWIVRGILPTSVLDDDWQEVRGNILANMNGFMVSPPEPLSEAELRAFGAETNFLDYIELFHAIHDPVKFSGPWAETDVPALLADQWEKEAANASEIRAALSEYFDAQEQARTEVFAAVVAGKIAAKGYWGESIEELQDRFSDSDRTLESSLIPVSEFVPSRFSWDESTLQTRAIPGANRKAGAYFFVTFDTSDVLRAFPLRRGKKTELLLLESAAIMMEDGSAEVHTSNHSPQRGRPPRSDWLKQGMRAWYETQKASGALGGKKEADIAAAMAWAASTGNVVQRTTVQNYLRGLL